MVVLPHRIGKYTLHRRIGGGGMGQVYFATLEGAGGFERDVAIKLIRSELAASSKAIAMFLREGRALAALSHRNVIHVFELDTDGDQLYLAMEYLRGIDLGQIRARGPLAWPAAVYIASEVARGLAAAHGARRAEAPNGIVHGDVSPSNVMVCNDGAVKVLDFGIARPVGFVAAGISGKLPYLPPESFVGSVIDERTDLYGLGVVLHELLIGARLFRASNDREIQQRVQHEVVPPPSATIKDLPPTLDALVMQTMNRDRARRPASATELANALDRILDGRFTVADLAILVGRLQQKWDTSGTTVTPLGRTEAIALDSQPRTQSASSARGRAGIAIGVVATACLLGGGVLAWQRATSKVAAAEAPRVVPMTSEPVLATEPAPPRVQPEPAPAAEESRSRPTHATTRPTRPKPARHAEPPTAVPEPNHEPKPDGSAGIAPGYLANPFDKK